MNPKSSLQTSTASPLPTTDLGLPASEIRAPRSTAFTLIELLVVVSIIGLLAGLAIPTIGGAMKSARKAEVAAVAQSVRTAILAWNSEYGNWPTNRATFQTDRTFLDLMTSSTNSANPRGIIFLEVPAKFTNSSGLVTPLGFFTGGEGARKNFSVAVDLTGSGTLNNVGVEGTTLRTSCAVWVEDPAKPNTSIGTWK